MKMKKLLTIIILFSSIIVASNKDNNTTDTNATENNSSTKKARIEKQIQREMEREKKYAKEQMFYQGDKYDLKSAEVNPDSLPSVPEIQEDDFNMDSVYD